MIDPQSPYDREQRRAARVRFFWTAGLVMLTWLFAQLALQLVASSDDVSAFAIRTIANVVQMGCVIGLFGWLLVTNTNRPSAIHPDDVLAGQSVTPPTTEDEPVLMINSTPIYGRREGDNVEAIRLAIQHLENPNSPLPENAPAWVKALAVRDVAAGKLDLNDLPSEEDAHDPA